jgi:hypothetical protein
MAFSGAWGKLTHEENLKSKISWHCPFNSSLDAKFSFADWIFFTLFSRAAGGFVISVYDVVRLTQVLTVLT